MTPVGIGGGEQVEADGVVEVRRVEVNEVVGTAWRDVLQDLGGEVAVGIRPMPRPACRS